MLSDCYSRNDVQVVNGKINFQVCNIFHHQSLERFNTAVERYATFSFRLGKQNTTTNTKIILKLQ